MTDDHMACERCGQPHDRCAAHNRRGGPCGEWPKTGQRVCHLHGGGKPAAIANGERREQERQAEQMLAKLWNPDATPITDSVGEMQRLAGSMRHSVDVLGRRLDADELEPVSATAWLRVLRELRTLLADMKRLGIAEYAVNVEAAKVKLMSVAFARALDVLEPSTEDREQATGVFLTELRSAAEVSEDGAA